MKRTSEELIIEFHQKMAHSFPGISFKQAKEICHGPWIYLHNQMESGELEEVRLKYFGTFQVYAGRARNLLIYLKERFRFNKIEKNEYFRIKEMLEKFMKKNE